MNVILARLKEPSTWAALGPTLAGLGYSLSPGALQMISYFGAGIALLLGIILPERPNP